MNEEKQKILIFGLGDFARSLLKEIADKWRVTAVDMHETRIQTSKEDVPNVDYIHGAPESELTWKKLDLTGVKYIISAVRSCETDLEVCRIARKVLKLTIPIIVLVYEKVDETLFEPFHVQVVNPMDLGVRVVLRKLTSHVSHAANVGLGQGELIEVKVNARSHLVDRKLKYLRPTRWHISALFRDNRLILPTGNCSIKMGDRVLLVGDPTVLENVQETLLKGLPQFPLQYGQEILFPLHRAFDAHMDEAFYWTNSFKARNIRLVPFKNKMITDVSAKIKNGVDKFKTGESIERFTQMFPVPPETGIVIVPVPHEFYKPLRVRMVFKRCDKPFLLSRKQSPYEGVIIQLNGPDPFQAMEAGVEIARLAAIPFRAVYVTLPKAMRGREEAQRLELRRRLIDDYEAIFKSDIPLQIIKGNPVLETLRFLEPYSRHLLVTVSNRYQSLAFYKPNVPFLISLKTRLSTLVIPETQVNE